MGPQTITLQVLASELFTSTIKKKADLDDYCCLINGILGPPGEKLKEFKTMVDKGDKITWKGDAIVGNLCDTNADMENPENYRVTIDSIAFSLDPSEKNFFENDPIMLVDNGNSGRVTNKQMKNSGLNQGNEYTYTINFSIHQGNVKKSYFIDPKLQIK